MNSIDLSKLRLGLPGITPDFGAFLAEAGAVCFEREGHDPGPLLIIQANFDTLQGRSVSMPVLWLKLIDLRHAIRCWNDTEFATEYGAVAVAILLMSELTGFAAFARSRKGTGFDYWLGEEDGPPFQKKARLEISGIRRGDNAAVAKRVNQKMKQISPSDGRLPGYIVVVEFGIPMSEVAKK